MKTPTALAVPIVMDEGGRFLRAAETLPDQIYRCPACQETLTRKAGSRKVLHFSHHGQTDCNGETALHAAAKRTVYQVVTDWLAGKAEPPTIQGRCNGLSLVYEDEDLSWNSGWECSALVKFPLRRDKVDECVMEETLEGGLRPDLTIRLNGKDILGIEIKVTHQVDSAKRERLDIWWVELDADAVLQNRLDWKPRQHNIEKLRRCAFCSQFDEGALGVELQRDVERWVRWWRSKWPKGPYISYQIEHRQRTLRKIFEAHAAEWTKFKGIPLPGEIQVSL